MSASFLPSLGLLPQRTRELIPEVLGTVVSGGGALTSWQVQTQWAFSVLAAIVALVSGILTIRSIIRKELAK